MEVRIKKCMSTLACQALITVTTACVLSASHKFLHAESSRSLFVLVFRMISLSRPSKEGAAGIGTHPSDSQAETGKAFCILSERPLLRCSDI